MTIQVIRDTQCIMTGMIVAEGTNMEHVQMTGDFYTGMLNKSVRRLPMKDCALIVEKLEDKC